LGAALTQHDEEVTFFTTYILNEFAREHDLTTPEAFGLLDGFGIVDGYVMRHYDVLHTLDTRYVVEDLDELLKIRQGQVA
jgi:hypothetical protein